MSSQLSLITLETNYIGLHKETYSGMAIEPVPEAFPTGPKVIVRKNNYKPLIEDIPYEWYTTMPFYRLESGMYIFRDDHIYTYLSLKLPTGSDMRYRRPIILSVLDRNNERYELSVDPKYDSNFLVLDKTKIELIPYRTPVNRKNDYR